MRFLMLYARSRHIPGTLPAAVVTVTAVTLLGRPHPAVSAAFAMAAGAALLALGLDGPFGDLDRTAARPWPPRRLAHLTAVAAIPAIVALIAGHAPAILLLRNGIGLAGLAALAARGWGARLAWTLPLAAGMAAVVLPAAPRPVLFAILTWPVQPAESLTAAAIAVLLAAIGATWYTGLVSSTAGQPPGSL